MSVARISDYQKPQLEVVEHRVADTDDGFIMLAMELYEELIGANLTRNQAKVAHAVCRKTYGFKKKMDRIADSQLAEICRISRPKANIAKNELIAMKVLVKDGSKIGPNKNISEWEIPECSQIDNIVTKSGTKNVTKLDTPSVTKTEHTKDIFKDKINNTPLPPTGESVKGGKPAKRKSNPIQYDDYLNAYNEAVGDRLPHAVEANDERKRKLAALVKSLATPNLEGFRSYVRAFMAAARPFHFGDNDRGWVANFDYLLQRKTLTKIREGTL
ncbi:replication protein [Symbiopectobacterium purcellii]|uniref:Replication protein n=1 Tax=Symbiopectobacterium purcellii TaxID=2871826 RepID=A0ABX9ARB1_9ENTR|nr:replication protein [Symbiopectobacterium purcellii]